MNFGVFGQMARAGILSAITNSSELVQKTCESQLAPFSPPHGQIFLENLSISILFSYLPLLFHTGGWMFWLDRQ